MGTEEEVIEQMFAGWDVDGSEKIDPKEVLSAMKEMIPGLTEEGAKKYTDFFDKNDDGELDMDEWQAAIFEDQGPRTAEEEAQSTMKMFDTNDDEKISIQEAKTLTKHFGGTFTEENEKDFLEADTDGDKEISGEELLVSIKKQYKEMEMSDQPTHHGDKKMSDDIKAIEDDIVDGVAVEEMENTPVEASTDAPEEETKEEETSEKTEIKSLLANRRLLTHPKLMPFLQKFQAEKSLPPPALNSWAAPAAGGFIMIPLLVAAVGCRRRLRVPARVDFEAVAQE